MNYYTVHVRPRSQAVLVREGFSWGAAVFGPLWLLARRAWLAALILLAAGIVLGALAHGVVLLVLAITLIVLQGVCGRDLWRWSLAQRQFVMVHVVAAADIDAALARLFAARPDLADGFVPAGFPPTGLPR